MGGPASARRRRGGPVSIPTEQPPVNLTATETEIIAPVIETNGTPDAAVETLHELAQPQPKKMDEQVGLPFLLEIGTEEVPDWMIPTALENLRLSFEKLEIPRDMVRLDAT